MVKIRKKSVPIRKKTVSIAKKSCPKKRRTRKKTYYA